MGKATGISWTDHTFNGWWGCVKISPACANCYADDWASRFGLKLWGKDAPRRFFGDKHWAEPLKWNGEAEAAGVRRRVFCSSMADVFEDRADLVPHRVRLLKLIEATPWLDWLLLTKRPENVLRMTYDAWCHRVPGHVSQNEGDGRVWIWPDNVWMGVTVEDRKHGLPRLELLRRIPAAVRFVSAEPLLEDLGHVDLAGIGWVIVGGESGKGARPMHPDWARSLRDQCVAAGVAYHFKQWGEWMPRSHTSRRHAWHAGQIPDGWRVEVKGNPAWGTIGFDQWWRETTPWNGHDDDGRGEAVMYRIGKNHTGRHLDGRVWDEVPTPAGQGARP